MAQKRNTYLDISDEEDDIISGSETEERGRLARISQPSGKRRKLNSDEEDSDQLLAADDEEVSEEETTTDINTIREHESKNQASTKSIPGLKLSNSHQRKKQKTGVIYLSRIPPFMKPVTLRHLLDPYGTLLRIFLTPEPTPAYQKRVKSGGNKKRSFVDGWVEFASKKKAKICAETLNGNIIGGKKGGYYHDDIWNIKYLKGFKWDDLMEQVQDEERIRGGRLRAEIIQEAKERRAFLENVEQDKMEKTREAKRKKRLDSDLPASTVQPDKEDSRPFFTQNKVKQKDKQTPAEPQEDLKRVLSKIF